ncbi:MAG: chemotaxis protein CheB [Gemmatimonadota bacterium]
MVGIGASAGGVEAFARLLKALPVDSGMSFVLLSHLSPSHHSELARIFSPLTPMPVKDAEDGEPIIPNQVYVLPSDRILTIADGCLHLTGRNSTDLRPSAIDQFFESLAIELGPLAVGVVLSGTGFDGTAGVRAIRAHGGVTYAQDPALSAFDGMPRSAVDSGAVDFTLTLEGIASALTTLARLGQESVAIVSAAPPSETDWDSDTDEDQSAPPISARDAEALDEIIRILQTSTGVDFYHYKRPSLVRRVRHRAVEIGLPDLSSYLERLRLDPAEVKGLLQVVLVQVTRFFRESKTFEVLQARVIPVLTKGRKSGDVVRVWVIGCASGEEVYSLAMAFLEVETALGVEVPVRIFASDVSDPALSTARLGLYPNTIAADISTARLERFFQPVDHRYQVIKRLREMCVFARHDITRDPPFAQLDLVLCCNVLIYLDQVLQRRLLQNMHYALKPGGYLMLGPAETTTGVEGLFSPFDPKHKIYMRRVGPARLFVVPGVTQAKIHPAGNDIPRLQTPRLQGGTHHLHRAAERAFFSLYPTASVIVNQEFDILHYEGPTGPYLQAPTGGPTAQVLRLAHPDLQLVMGRMLRRVKKDRSPARQLGIRVATGRQTRRVNLAVLPVSMDDSEEPFYLVVFEAVAGKGLEADGSPGKHSGRDAARVLELEAELAESKEYLQTFIDQQDAAHAELQAAYEASLSVNEEYQSTNEELESAKEELQSLNEELTTVNEQMQQRSAEVQARSAEVSGLLEALDMPILLLTRDLRLRAYNSRAAADFHLSQARIGRQLGDTSLPVPSADLAGVVERALGEAKVQDLELQDRQGRWQTLRAWPIQSGSDEGTAAIAFMDIAKLKADVAEERDARSYSEAVVETILDPLVVLDENSRMLHANRAFHRTFGTDAESFEPRDLGQLGGKDWNPAVIDAFLALAAHSDRPLDGPEISLISSRLGRRIFQLGAGTIRWQGPRRILLALKDVTERKLAEEAALETSRMQAVGQLAGGVAHEINNQMTVVIGLATFLLRDTADGDPRKPDITHILKAADRSAAVSQQLLAFSRRQMLLPVTFDLNSMVGMAETNLRPFLRSDIVLEVVLGDQVGQVRADLAQMEQLLVNLAINARDAMTGPGRLKIETTTVRVTEAPTNAPDTSVVPRGVYARLCVSDTGHGMDAATTARIFEPFFTTKGIGQGTGLGLASVYGVVKQSGGLIWVDSEIGKGTTFTIDLPQVTALAPPPKTVAEPTATVRGTGTILVVDDQEMVRAWVTRTLREIGYSTIEANDGHEVLRLLAEGTSEVDMVISDVSMPGMDGAELSKRLAELRPDLPMLFMSGFAEEDLVHRGKVVAGTTILLKPFSAAALGEKVREALANSVKV